MHLDEKWIHNEYIKKYQNIEPIKDDLKIFINKLINITDNNLIITTGIKSNKLTEYIKIKSSIVNENISFLKKDNLKIIICENIEIFDLIFLISKSSLLITCHGSPTHIASSFNIKTIDIIDNSEIGLFNKYVAHLRNYNQICRQSFKDLADEIYKLLT